MRVELRRRTIVCRANGDTLEFPRPREEHCLVLRLIGLPIFARNRAIGLPEQAAEDIDALHATEFDVHFSGAFRLSGDWQGGQSAALGLPRHAH